MPRLRQSVQVVNAHAFGCYDPTFYRNRHVNQRGGTRVEEAVALCRGLVAQRRAGPTCQQRGPQLGVARQGAAEGSKCGTVHAPPAPGIQVGPELVASQSERQQLVERRDAVLLCQEVVEV